MPAHKLEKVCFQNRPRLHKTPEGRRSAREALARIHRAQGLNAAPTREELLSWASHEDERVPIAALGALFVLLESPIPWALVPDARDLFRMCVGRAIDDADQAGFLWTPMLDALASNTPWWITKYFEHDNGLVLEKAKLAEAYLAAHPEAASVDLLTAVRWAPIRDAIFTKISLLGERDVRRILASDDIPPEGMTSHPGLTPEAADAMWDVLRHSFRARLLAYPKVQEHHHDVVDWELARIGSLLRSVVPGDETAVPLLDSTYLEELLVLLELGILVPRSVAEIALTIIALDRSEDGDLIRQVWRALERQGLQDCFHYDAAYAHPHYSLIAVEVASDLVRDNNEDWRELFRMLKHARMTSDIADCMASANHSRLRMKALPHMSPRMFRKVFAELVLGNDLEEGALDKATDAQLAAVRGVDWRRLLKSKEPWRDLTLARIPSARRTRKVRALLIASTDAAVLSQLCRSNELSVPECVALFDRIVALDPQYSLLPLQDPAIVRAILPAQLTPLFVHSDNRVRSAALVASAMVQTEDDPPPLRRVRKAKSLKKV